MPAAEADALLGDSAQSHSPKVGPKHLLGQTVDWIRSETHSRAGVPATIAGRVSHRDDTCLEAHCLLLTERTYGPKLCYVRSVVLLG